MGSRYLTDLADVCRRTGWPVIEVDGWQQRARGSGGYNSGLPNHVMVHHTASGPGSDGWDDVNYCTFGDADAPLCNLYLSRVPEIYVCAAGATNTNGSGSDPCGRIGDDSMNSSAIGIEAANDGVGEHWPPAQQAAYVDLVTELAAAYGIAPAQCHAHFEWTSRKIDPAGPSEWALTGSWNMAAFRADVELGTPPPNPPTEGVVDMYVIAVSRQGWPGPVDLVVDSANTRWNANGNTSSLDRLAGVPRLEVDKDQALGVLQDRPGTGRCPFSELPDYADSDLAW